MAMNIGFVGLGVMGRPMAENLQKGGHNLFVTSRSGVPSAFSYSNVTSCANPGEVTAKTDIVILMVPDTSDVESVLHQKDGVLEHLRSGSIVIDMSSISPIATKQFAHAVEKLNCQYLDAPVSGGEIGAKAATLTIMVGGPQTAFERARPLFELMGKNITLIGENGAGQTTKIANQIIVALNIEAVAEALLFVSKSGVDPIRVRQALLGGFANSRVLEVHGERMIKRAFNPGFRIDLHQKDLGLALQIARVLGLSLPNTANTQELLNACSAHGGSEWDHSAMIRALELLANHELHANKD